MSVLLSQLAGWGRFRAVVLGDFMLDEHVYGAAERLSPDAPVPVLQVVNTEQRAGGAANVALCLRALGADVSCVGVTGDDAGGAVLREQLGDQAVEVSGLVVDAARPTTVKRSLVGLAQHRHPQKMFRMDQESKAEIEGEVAAAVLGHIERVVDDADVVCLEDYNKGVCSPELCAAVVDMCRTKGKPLLVDPASRDDYTRYRGATAITPNRTEAERATGLDTPLDASVEHNEKLGGLLLESLELEAVVLTLDRHGALLLRRDEPPLHVPTHARHVYDVTGAGDMVLSALAGAIANGIDWPGAVEFANAAAGLEVEVFGVKPIPFAQVHREVMRRQKPAETKVRGLDELLVEVAAHREAGQRVILTNGCFDVIHAGHVAYLREAKALGDVLVVAVNSDAQVCAQKGEGRPIYKQPERLEILGELNCIDYLVVFEEPTVGPMLRAVSPDVYVKGGDYSPEEINEYGVVQELGVELQVLQHRPGLSSTDVIERMVRTRG